jgi:hypothetical protein
MTRSPMVRTRAGQLRVEGQPQAHPVRKAHHPLPTGRAGQHVVDEKRGSMVQRGARGTAASAFARKTDESVVATAVAVDAKKTSREDPMFSARQDYS